ncbi:MAG: response regulator transcription factor [Chitinophagaceae bacterium]
MEKYNCIIVEDEPLAAEILQDYISQIGFLDLKATCRHAIAAMEVLQENKIDVIFLDIHLPRIKGVDFVRTLKHPPQIIITSAYQEYALEGYELNVLDYLLKPVEFSRFLMAVNKIKTHFSAKENMAENKSMPVIEGTERQYMFFNINKKKVKIYVDEILYIESLKEYIKIITIGKSIMVKFQLSQIEELLKKGKFLRIHRSFIIAKNKVDAFTATEVEIAGKEVPIGRSYKEHVMLQLASE